ncbi:MAG: hypothetical protein LBK06_02805 [Planctomycetaceae bacterium]|nr:hypothetical protein [Planctomycetaceae bacterium]
MSSYTKIMKHVEAILKFTKRNTANAIMRGVCLKTKPSVNNGDRIKPPIHRKFVSDELAAIVVWNWLEFNHHKFLCRCSVGVLVLLRRQKLEP